MCRLTDLLDMTLIVVTGLLNLKQTNKTNDPKYLDRQVCANSVDPDQIPEV